MENINNDFKKTFVRKSLMISFNGIKEKTSSDAYYIPQLFFGQSDTVRLISFKNNIIYAKDTKCTNKNKI